MLKVAYCVQQKEKEIHLIDMSPQTPTILLSGASGVVGSALRQALAARKQPVLQLVRHSPASPAQLQWNPAANTGKGFQRPGRVPFRRGNGSALTGLEAIANPAPLENLTAAIHLSGANLAAHRWTSAYKREMIASRVQSTRVLATVLSSLHHPPESLLVASAIGIYGDRANEFLDESSVSGSGFLADLCQQWEAAAQPAVDAGIRVVNLRFGVVLGPVRNRGANPGALARIVPLFRLGLGGLLGDGQQWMSWIALTDAIAAILFALHTRSIAGPVNLTAPQPATNAEFTRALARQLHRRAILPAPTFALRLALGEMADEALLASARAFPSKLLAAGFQFAQPSIAQALAYALAPAS